MFITGDSKQLTTILIYFIYAGTHNRKLQKTTMTNYKVEKLIYKMLTTNTGIHMLDSGGDNNRAWQRNQKKTIADFRSEPVVSFDAEGAKTSEDITFSVSVFHYLTNILELDEVCERFNKLPCLEWDGEFYGTSEDQVKKLFKLLNIVRATQINYNGNEDIYLDKNTLERWTIDTVNTYNGEEHLSQVLQFNRLESPSGDTYVLLQIHNGADVRGGYTDAKLFKFIDSDIPYIQGNPEVSGTIDGKEVTTGYNGWCLTDWDGNYIKVKPDSSIELFAYFN